MTKFNYKQTINRLMINDYFKLLHVITWNLTYTVSLPMLPIHCVISLCTHSNTIAVKLTVHGEV